MTWETIVKDPVPRALPNLADYDRLRSEFTWSRARSAPSGLPGGRGLNIAYETVDRHADSGRGVRIALRCVARDDTVSTVTYADLARRTSLRHSASAAATGCSRCSAAVRSSTRRC